MSLIERVRACRRHSLRGRAPFRVGGRPLGWVAPETARALARGGEAFVEGPGDLRLRAGLDDPAERTLAVERALRRLEREGLLEGWRGERYAVTEAWGAPPAFEIERAAAPLLGVRAFGVHVNAWVRGPRGPRLWVAVRSRSKASSPGKLDHLVAGGQPAGLSLRANLAKEAAEEAGLPARLVEGAQEGWPFRYRLAVPGGLRDDTLFVFDLELPEDATPRAVDGEVESFALWPLEAVLERLRGTEDFKFNVGPCILGFVLRQAPERLEPGEREALLELLAPPRGGAEPDAPGD